MWSEIKGDKRKKKEEEEEEEEEEGTVDHVGAGWSVVQNTFVDPGLSGGCDLLAVVLQENNKKSFKTTQKQIRAPPRSWL